MKDVMKKFFLFFAVFFMTVHVNAQLSGFHTVRKKIELKKIVAYDATPLSGVAESATPPGDVTVVPPLEADTVADVTVASPFLFSVPLESDTLVVNSPYGYRSDPFTGRRRFHGGVDLRASGDNVYAMMPGRIRDVGYSKGLGNYITLEHGDMRVTYGHLFTVTGRKGDSVRAGQSVGITGSTGRSTGEHLHVAVRYKGRSIDPLPVISYISAYVRKVRDFTVPADTVPQDTLRTAGVMMRETVGGE